MSKHEALARFPDWCGAGHRKADTRRGWRCRCIMHPQRSPLTNVLTRIQLLRRNRIHASAPAVDLRSVKEI